MKWTKKEIELLEKLFKLQKSKREISKELNRSYPSIRGKAIRMGLIITKKWTQKEIELAIILLKSGNNFRKISETLNRTHTSVSKKLNRCGIKYWKCNSSIKTIKHSVDKKCSTYEKYNWVLIQNFYDNNSTYRGIIKKFNLTPTAIKWACDNVKLKLRNRAEACQKAIELGRRGGSNKDGLEQYRQKCGFNFNLSDYPCEFDFNLIKKYGWYKAYNRGNNPNGVSRDHMYSIKSGFNNKINPYYISHPANCTLMRHNNNNIKKTKCSLTLNELLNRIDKWNKKYNSYKKYKFYFLKTE